MKSLIFSDEDADGICSARIAQLTVGGDVWFQKWHTFGITPDDIVRIKAYHPQALYFLDLGCEKETLELLNSLVKEGIKVTLLDNHPPKEDASYIENYRNKNFIINTTADNCTAGITYDFFKDALVGESLKWAQTWASVGITGDVATETVEGARILNEIRGDSASLFSNVGAWAKDEMDKWQRMERPYLQQMSSYFQTCKRMCYDKGGYLALQVCSEIEKSGDIFLLERTFTDEEMAIYPASTTLKALYQRFKESKIWQDSSTNLRLYYVGKVSFSVIEHPWNVSTYIATFKARETHRTHFCINTWGKDNLLVIGARNPPKEDTQSFRCDIGEVFDQVTLESKNKINGGGIPEAGSAHATVGTPLSYIIDTITQVVEEYF